MWPGTAGRVLPGRGSSLSRDEVIAGSQASMDRAGVVRVGFVRLGSSGLLGCLGALMGLQVPPCLAP